MKLITFILSSFILTQTINSSIAATCSYRNVNSDYICELYNPIDDDEITQINGTHISDFDDDDVTIVKSNGGKMKIFNNFLTNKFKNLTTIELNGYEIEIIRDDSLEFCEKLEKFNLNDNKIVNISVNLFENCRILKIIQLNNNNFEWIPIDAIENLRTLRELHLNHNKISNVSTFQADDYTKDRIRVTSLDLSYNPIKSLGTFSLFRFGNLENLDLSYCEISNYNYAAIEMFSIINLNLSNNKINSISGQFGTSSYLEVLNLSSNLITDLDVTSFSYLIFIKHLDLSNNLIRNIDSRALQLSNIEILNLNSNNLTILRRNMLEYSVKQKLMEIHVKDNQILYIEDTLFELTPNLVLFDASGNICVDAIIENIENLEILSNCFRNFETVYSTTLRPTIPPFVPPERSFWSKYGLIFSGVAVGFSAFSFIISCCVRSRKRKAEREARGY